MGALKSLVNGKDLILVYKKLARSITCPKYDRGCETQVYIGQTI